MDYFQNTDLSPATKNLYNHRLAVIARITGKSFRELFMSPRFTVIMLRKYLTDRESYSAQNFHSHIKSLMAYKKYHPAEFVGSEASQLSWNVLLKQTFEKANEYRSRGEMAPSQAEKAGASMTLREIEAIRDRLEDGEEAKLLIAMYTMIPPMRADYGEVELVMEGNQPSYANFIYFRGDHAVMNIADYKMANSLGPVKQVLPERLRRLLLRSIADRPRRFLFGPYSDPTFSVWANKLLTMVFGKPFTLTLFRHAYINAMDPRMSVEDRRRVAYLMGQSYHENQQDLYRWSE